MTMMRLQDQEDILLVETIVKSILILGEIMLLWLLLLYDEETENLKEIFNNMKDIFSTKIWFTRGRGKLMGK